MTDGNGGGGSGGVLMGDVGGEDHDRLLLLDGEVKRIWDRFRAEKEALQLAANQWPTREELGGMLNDLKLELQTAGVPRVEYTTAHEALETRVDDLREANVAALALAAARSRLTTILIGAAGVIIAAAAVLISTR